MMCPATAGIKSVAVKNSYTLNKPCILILVLIDNISYYWEYQTSGGWTKVGNANRIFSGQKSLGFRI